MYSICQFFPKVNPDIRRAQNGGTRRGADGERYGGGTPGESDGRRRREGTDREWYGRNTGRKRQRGVSEIRTPERYIRGQGRYFLAFLRRESFCAQCHPARPSIAAAKTPKSTICRSGKSPVFTFDHISRSLSFSSFE